MNSIWGDSIYGAWFCICRVKFRAIPCPGVWAFLELCTQHWTIETKELFIVSSRYYLLNICRTVRQIRHLPSAHKKIQGGHPQHFLPKKCTASTAVQGAIYNGCVPYCLSKSSQPRWIFLFVQTAPPPSNLAYSPHSCLMKQSNYRSSSFQLSSTISEW